MGLFMRRSLAPVDSARRVGDAEFVTQFQALRIHGSDDAKTRIEARLERVALADLSPGEVTIRVAWSGINYKDALAATGKGRILRRYPLIGGVDLSGVVVESAAPSVPVGARVLVTGCGLSETRDGGYAEYARVPADAVVPLPASLDLRTAMAVGTAGFAAALAVHRLEHNGLAPGQGPVVVTGATGGVGSIAIDMLSVRGHEVIAVTGKPAESGEYLRSLGAADVVAREALVLSTRPLEPARYAGAVDNVGGALLSLLLRSCHPWGSVASVGMAGGSELATSVMPFILRGVNLLGINSSATRREPRLALWQRIGTDLAPRHLERIVTDTVALTELPAAFDRLIAGSKTGRTLVRVSGET
jgi:acrylyl-CoA reductase (NADPH)